MLSGGINLIYYVFLCQFFGKYQAIPDEMSITSILFCNSQISDETNNPTDIKYYLFNNNASYTNIIIDSCSSFNHTIYVYDNQLNVLDFNDKKSPIFLQLTEENDQYIIGITSSNLQYGQYDINITCQNNASFISSTDYYTTTISPMPDLIFYDPMKSINDWIISSSDHISQWPLSNQSVIRCTDSNNQCIRINGYLNQDCYIKRFIKNNYKYYQLKFDLFMSSVESDDSCNIKYSFDDNIWIQLNSYQGDKEAIQILNQSYIINNNDNNESLLYIMLEANGDSSNGIDYCYWDNVYLYGSQFEISLPIIYPYLDSIQDYIECSDTKYGTITSTDMVHYYAFDNQFTNLITINLCNSAYDAFINVWDQYGIRIYSDHDSCQDSGPIIMTTISAGMYIIEIRGYDGGIGSYVLELECLKIQRYLECGDSIWDETTPNDNPHNYAFMNPSQDNIITADTCNSEYVTKTNLDLYQLDVASMTPDYFETVDACYNSSYNLWIGSTTYSYVLPTSSLLIIQIDGFGGLYNNKNYNLKLDCSITPAPIVSSGSSIKPTSSPRPPTSSDTFHNMFPNLFLLLLRFSDVSCSD